MNVTRLSSLACCLAVLGLTGQTLRSQAPPVATPEQLMAELYQCVTQGIAGGRLGQNNVVISLKNPGDFIEKGTTEDDAGDMNGLYHTLDIIPDPTPSDADLKIGHPYSQIWTDSAMTYSGAYGYILDNKKYPDDSRSLDQMAKDDAQLKDLRDKTSISNLDFQNYLNLQQQYTDASAAYDQAITDLASLAKQKKLYTKADYQVKAMATDDPDAYNAYNAGLATLTKQVNVAEKTKTLSATSVQNVANQWRAVESTYNGYFQKIAQLSNKSNDASWQRFQTAFDLGKANAADPSSKTYKVTFIPPPSKWNPDEDPNNPDGSWVHITLSSARAASDNVTTSESSSMGASWCGVGGKSGSENAMATAIKTAKNLSVEFEIKPVFVFRDWLDPVVLHSGNWWFPSTSDKQGPAVISYGDTTSGTKNTGPKAMMPILTNAIILARKLKLHGDDLSSFAQVIHSATSSSGGAFGPFNLSASHTKAYDQTKTESLKNVTDIEADGVQIIGYISSVVPPTPSGSAPGTK